MLELGHHTSTLWDVLTGKSSFKCMSGNKMSIFKDLNLTEVLLVVCLVVTQI